MHINKLLLCIALALSSASANAQYPKDNPADDVLWTKNMPKLKKLVMTDIPGAPVLQQPVRIDGSEQEIRTNKHGLCYPAFFDWNHDGKPDLLLGEFSTGKLENNIKVFINEGTRQKPRFSGKYFYARDAKGDTISNYQWCCIGIHPRLVDIDGDGQLDLLSGQYNPGLISLWRGSEKGFLPMEYVPQEGYSEGAELRSQNLRSPNSNLYWNYTSASFADFNGDGLLDLFVGGSAGPRVALNDGTKEQPRFGLRNYLYMTDGNILTPDLDKPQHEGSQPAFHKMYLHPVDWDGDGVLDILLTHEYSNKGSWAISFFKGVVTNLGLRFEHPVPLFTTADGSKALPGCQPMIYIDDLNGDGVKDIVMGLSIPTLHYEACTDLAWQWIADLGIEMPGKDAGEYYMFTTRDSLLAKIDTTEWARKYYLGNLNDNKYIDLRHRGYTYVFYGKQNKALAEARTLTLEAPKPKETKGFDDGSADEPLTYAIDASVNHGSVTLKITLRFKDGWHGYAEGKATETMGMIPTTVRVEVPKEKGYLMGTIDSPYVGSNPIYTGSHEFIQSMYLPKLKEGDVPIKIYISYQACDDSMCLPPVEHIIDYVIKR